MAEEDPCDLAGRMIAAYRGLTQRDYVSVRDLMKAAGMKLPQMQAAFDLLNGPVGRGAGWLVYCELPFRRGPVVVTRSGDRVALIKLVKREPSSG